MRRRKKEVSPSIFPTNLQYVVGTTSTMFSTFFHQAITAPPLSLSSFNSTTMWEEGKWRRHFSTVPLSLSEGSFIFTPPPLVQRPIDINIRALTCLQLFSCGKKTWDVVEKGCKVEKSERNWLVLLYLQTVPVLKVNLPVRYDDKINSPFDSSSTGNNRMIKTTAGTVVAKGILSLKCMAPMKKKVLMRGRS